MTDWLAPDPDDADMLRMKAEQLHAALSKPELRDMSGNLVIEFGDDRWLFGHADMKLCRGYVWSVFNGVEPLEATYRALFPILSTEAALTELGLGVQSCINAVHKLIEGARINIPVRSEMADAA